MDLFPRGRPTVCTIDLDALRWNFRQAREKVGAQVKILSVVKADAYGHGAHRVAETLVEAGTNALGVATLEEGIALRERGIAAPVLILAGAYPDSFDELVRHGLTPTVFDAENLDRLEEKARRRDKPLDFHLKVDTGMGRIGFLANDIAAWLPRLKKSTPLRLAGLFSHFSQSESVEGEYTLRQLELFKRTVERIRGAGHDPGLIHLANSAAIITLPAAYFSMVRPGLMLYGAYPSAAMAEAIALRPALAWKSRLVQLKKVPKGTAVSYGQTFVTRRESLIATLPVGYADGYRRLGSNRAEVLVRGRRAPVAGRICMDLTTIDVTDIPGVAPGDEVVLLGEQNGERISADEVARWADTIPYEIFTSIGARVPRVYLN
jgi:alanine racemase